MISIQNQKTQQISGNFRLKDKVALITGASQGIGLATAAMFAQEGAKVIITDIQQQRGQEASSSINTIDSVKISNGNACFFKLDVALEQDWINAIEFIRQKFNGKLDILFNNAGVTGFEFGPQDVENITLESWKKIHTINLDGIMLGCKYAIMLMKNSKNCSIINMASRSGLVGILMACAYASTKAAVINCTKSAALYCAQQKYDIRANCISAILTPMWDEMLE